LTSGWGTTSRFPNENTQILIDLNAQGDVGATLTQLSTTVTLDARGYRLDPGKFILAQTLETVSLRLPPEIDAPGSERPVLAARVEGKSSRARFGLLIHFTAPTIHAGWSGPITLEIMCLGGSPFLLTAGMPICQLIIEQAEGIPTEAPSQFQGQRSPAGEQ